MDMSKPSNTDDMETWKPYLHTSLFSSFANTPDSGEPFLFPTFRIYSTTTFLAACAFTFLLSLLERYLSYLLSTTLSLHASNANSRAYLSSLMKRKNSIPPPTTTTTPATTTTSSSSNMYVTLASTATNHNYSSRRRGRGGRGRLVVRSVVFFGVTLIRYVLMIVGMGMDWFMLLSLVAGLTVGNVLDDLVRAGADDMDGGEKGEEVELLQAQFDVDDDEEVGRKREEADYLVGMAHRRSTSRHAGLSATAPY